ncbi:hypothetical protein BQ8482_160120 [Mesorhizobium delmotii]|uniref:Uncharacterized protein n=1 Tax=Mesorhizobium delmotii TaxID=1631247 RepID=A0A2P9AHP5_9HYPH|nr:hypothetical protein BQ8482_160120 [Mesorhizobium delmotii]
MELQTSRQPGSAVAMRNMVAKRREAANIPILSRRSGSVFATTAMVNSAGANERPQRGRMFAIRLVDGNEQVAP